jgi:hypothetical protein
MAVLVLKGLSAEERKEFPLMRGCLDYFPNALLAVANVSYEATKQHHPGQEMHWEREKSTDHADCALRHLTQRGTRDTDGKRHTAKAAWRVLAMLELEIEADARKKQECVVCIGECSDPALHHR